LARASLPFQPAAIGVAILARLQASREAPSPLCVVVIDRHERCGGPAERDAVRGRARPVGDWPVEGRGRVAEADEACDGGVAVLAEPVA